MRNKKINSNYHSKNQRQMGRWQVKSTRLLGLVINDKLTWNENTKNIVTRAYQRMVILHNLFEFNMPIIELLNIYILYVRSILEQSWESSCQKIMLVMLMQYASQASWPSKKEGTIYRQNFSLCFAVYTSIQSKNHPHLCLPVMSTVMLPEADEISTGLVRTLLLTRKIPTRFNYSRGVFGRSWGVLIRNWVGRILVTRKIGTTLLFPKN